MYLDLQAGFFLWQQLLPKKAAAQREELLKLDVAGVSLTCTLSLLSDCIGQQSHQLAGPLSSCIVSESFLQPCKEHCVFAKWGMNKKQHCNILHQSHIHKCRRQTVVACAEYQQLLLSELQLHRLCVVICSMQRVAAAFLRPVGGLLWCEYACSLSNSTGYGNSNSW